VAFWSAADARVAAVAAALAPYPWRGFTDRMLARRVVGAAVRHDLSVFLTGLPGTDVGEHGPLEPADRGDERVEALVRVLGPSSWRGHSLDRLSRDLLTALDRWRPEHGRSRADR